MKPTLDELAVKYDADKAISKLNGDKTGHGYTIVYEEFFESLRDLPVKLLEIGVGGGPSIQMWLEYFEHGEIYGLDIASGTNPWNTPGGEGNLRYTFMQGNQSDKTMWECYFANSGRDFDVIIDDGSHMSGDIITAFGCAWPAVKKGGLYCVEDLAVGATPGSVFLTAGFPAHSRWIAELFDQMNLGQSDIAEMHLSRELAIIRKKA
ncbi:MAG TPA: class I SAM-dependent methyltransferase [Candidatus Binatia bacterium]